MKKQAAKPKPTPKTTTKNKQGPSYKEERPTKARDHAVTTIQPYNLIKPAAPTRLTGTRRTQEPQGGIT
jgi:hypothetical protein